MQKDYIDLQELTKNSSLYYFLIKPDFIAFTSFTSAFISLFILAGYPLWVSLIISSLIALYIRFAVPEGDEGMPHISRIFGMMLARHKQHRGNEHIGINYFNLGKNEYLSDTEVQEKVQSFEMSLVKNLIKYIPLIGPKLIKPNEDYSHIATVLGILGIRSNIIKLKDNKWVGIFKITTSHSSSSPSDREFLEKQFQYLLNLLHSRGLEFQVFFNKQHITKKYFENYFTNLDAKVVSQQVDILKKMHVKSIENEYFDTTITSNLELHIAIYMSSSNKILNNSYKNLETWDFVYLEVTNILEELNRIEGFRVKQLSNLELKSFIAKLYMPQEAQLNSENLVSKEILKRSDTKEKASNSNETNKLIKTMSKLFKYLKQNKDNSLEHLGSDCLNYLPQTIKFDAHGEFVNVDDYFETTIAIPTNNKIVSNKIVKSLASYDFVTNITYRCVPLNKNRFVNKLELKDRNERNDLAEFQLQKDKAGGVSKRRISEIHSYLEEIISDTDKEVFQTYLLFNITANTRETLKEQVTLLKHNLYNLLGIKVHQALHTQKYYYLASKVSANMYTRNVLPMDSMRLSKFMPIPWYTFSDNKGFLLGKSSHTGEPTFFDPANFDVAESGSAILLAKTRHGKSALLKQWLIRSTFIGYKNVIIDNTGEYTARVAKELGYKIYKIGTEHVKINPFQLFINSKSSNKKTILEIRDAQINDILIPTFSLLLENINFKTGLLDKLLHFFYNGCDNPNMGEFVKFLKGYIEQLEKLGDDTEKAVVEEWLDEIIRYDTGSLRNVFGDSNDFKQLHKQHGIVFDISELDSTKCKDSQKHLTAIMHIIVANLWLMAKIQREPRFVFIDEAHHFLGSESTALYLAKLAKEGGKDQLYPIVSTQDLSDFLSNELAKKIITNVYTKIYGRLDHINAEYQKVLAVPDEIVKKLQTLKIGEFYIQRKSESMVFQTEFLTKWEELICDTQKSDYRMPVELPINVINLGKYNSHTF